MPVCRLARASDEQVIVGGSERFVGAVRRGGHDVPLLRALKEVVPTSYSVIVPNAGSWTEVPVSWHPGSVTHVLGEILSVNRSLQAHIDSDLHIVTVTGNAGPTRPAENAASQSGAADAPSSSMETDHASSSIPLSAVGMGRAAAPPLLAAAPAPASAPATPNTSMAPAVTTTMLAIAPPPSDSPTSSAAAPMNPPERTEWQMRASDGTVRNALARWASEAGWQFIWDVPTDFAVDATATIHGTLPDALRQVADALAGSQVPIQVVLYNRNRVMRVVVKGASS